MVTKNILFLIITTLTISQVWGADEIPQFQQGDQTLSIGGNGNSNKEFSNNALSFNVAWSTFVCDEVALALRQEISFADVSNDQAWNASTRFAVDYYFGTGRVKPFVGANIGYLYGDNVKEQFIAGPEVGIKTFLNSSTFIYLNAEYQFLFQDADQADNNFDNGRFVYSLGLGFRW
jgi:outer membrane protein W